MTPMDGNGPPALLARRGFLGALALAPAALACATSGARRPPASAAQRSDDSPAAREMLALEAVRSFAPARDARPAIVFRAAPARPGGTR